MTCGVQGGLILLHVTCYPVIQKCDVGGKLDFFGLHSTRWVTDLHKIFFSKKEKNKSRCNCGKKL